MEHHQSGSKKFSVNSLNKGPKAVILEGTELLLNAKSGIWQWASDVGKSGIAPVIKQRLLRILDSVCIESDENPNCEEQAANQSGHGAFLVGKRKKYAQQEKTQERSTYDSE